MKRVDHADKAEVKAFRESLGGQKEAAKIAGCSVRQWQRLESGASGVNKLLADKIRSRLATIRKRR